MLGLKKLKECPYHIVKNCSNYLHSFRHSGQRERFAIQYHALHAVHADA